MKVLFLDLDRTLLDDEYKPQDEACEFLNKLRENRFIIVFNSSKTFKEQEYYRKILNIKDPFIVENGAAIYFPEEFKGFLAGEKTTHRHGYYIVQLTDVTCDYVRKVLDSLSRRFRELKYYGNSTVKEIERFTELPEHLVHLAKEREYSETIFNGYCEEVENILKNSGLFPQKGSRFVTVSGNVNKGKAARRLMDILGRKYPLTLTCAMGDGENDIPMFRVVDKSFIVGKKIDYPGGFKIQKLGDIWTYI